MASNFMNYLLKIRYETNELIIMLKNDSMICIPLKAMQYMRVMTDDSTNEEYLYIDSRHLLAHIHYNDIDIEKTVNANEESIEYQLRKLIAKEHKEEKRKSLYRRRTRRIKARLYLGG